MKKPLCFFLVIFLLNCKLDLCGQKFKTEIHTDGNGYRYETVTNDPAGLRVYTLKNGLTVYLARNTEVQKISYTLSVRAGTKYGSAAYTGQAHYLEHLLFNGTDKIGTLDWKQEEPLLTQIENLYEQHNKTKDTIQKNALFRKIDQLSYEASKYGIKEEYRKLIIRNSGSGINATTNSDWTIFGTSISKPALENLLMIEKERFSKPAYRAFSTELEIVFEEFNQIQDNPFLEKYLAINQAIYKNHPYRLTNIGKAEHLKNPSVRSIKNYFNTYYVPNNMAIILYGDIDFEQSIQYTEKTFGTLKSKPVPTIDSYQEEPIEKPVEIEISSSKPASILMGFRGNGVRSTDLKYITLVHHMLENKVTGMLNTALKIPQKLKEAKSIEFGETYDYRVHYLEGVPNPGQSLKEVKEALLYVLEKLKQGEFEAWMIKACVNDIRREFVKQITSDQNLNTVCAKMFAHYTSWAEKLSFYDEMGKITKTELVAFAKRFYNNNYVVLYKKQGDEKTIVKAENPKITPIRLNADQESAFSKTMKTNSTGKVSPVYVDYEKEIQEHRLRNGLSVTHLKNKENDFFEFHIIFDAGQNNDRLIPLAFSYLNWVSTTKYNQQSFQEELYKIGLSVSYTLQYNQMNIRLTGSQENFDAGIQLMNHLFSEASSDDTTFSRFIEANIKSRATNRNNARAILHQGLRSYALYGEQSPLRNILSEQELRSLTSKQLTDIIKTFKQYRHRFFYYGNNLPAAIEALNKSYGEQPADKQFPAAIQFKPVETKPVIYFTDVNQSQASVLIIARGQQFNLNSIVYANMYNRFIESLTYEEIRNKRALAYSVWATYEVSADTTGYDIIDMFAATQANKITESLNVMTDLMKNTPEARDIFKLAKEDQLTRFEKERIRGINIFWNAESYKKMGIRHDYRKNMYEAIQKMTFEDMQLFFNRQIRNNNFAILIAGPRKDMDMTALKQFADVKELTADYLFNYR